MRNFVLWQWAVAFATQTLRADHLNARDLDLFDEGSLFELLCDVHTLAGRNTLAKGLQTPAPTAEVISREHAVRSLRNRTDLWRKGSALTTISAQERWSNRMPSRSSECWEFH